MNTERLAFLMGAKQYSGPIARACQRWGISNPRDQARFIAQLHVETSGFKYSAELTNYSVTGLVKTFGSRNGLTTEKAKLLVAAGPRAVFNFIYGGEWGRKNLGNIRPDDGWEFRGRGLIQTTGRENYKKTSIGCYGDERLLSDPDILLLPEEAANSAAWYWYNSRLNGVTDIRAVTKKINGGSSHLDRRIGQTNRAYDLVEFLAAK